MAQTIFGVTPVQITSTGVNYNWTAIDLSAYIPVGATGVILRAWNPVAVKSYGIRKNGSTDDRYYAASGAMHCWAMIGVDSNRKIQFKNGGIGSTMLDLYGYTMPGVQFFTNATLISAGALGSWVDVDLSALIPARTLGVLVEVLCNSGTSKAVGVRKYGSTDDRTHVNGNLRNIFTAAVGVSDDLKIQIYREVGNILMYLNGYITSGAYFHTNAVDISQGAINGWRDLVTLPANGRFGFIELVNNGAGTLSVRKNGYVESELEAANRHAWGILESDEYGQIEGYRDDLASSFFLTGYGFGTRHTNDKSYPLARKPNVCKV